MSVVYSKVHRVLTVLVYLDASSWIERGGKSAKTKSFFSLRASQSRSLKVVVVVVVVLVLVLVVLVVVVVIFCKKKL